MSTYLVAFLVGDFQCTTGESDGVAIRVCSTPDKVALTPYGVDVAKYVLHYYNNYFGIPYPLKKLDLIACPTSRPAPWKTLAPSLIARPLC
jgi:aminopeptidase N